MGGDDSGFPSRALGGELVVGWSGDLLGERGDLGLECLHLAALLRRIEEGFLAEVFAGEAAA